MKQDIREIIEIHNILNSYIIYHNILLLISIHVILQVVALLRSKCGGSIGSCCNRVRDDHVSFHLKSLSIVHPGRCDGNREGQLCLINATFRLRPRI